MKRRLSLAFALVILVIIGLSITGVPIPLGPFKGAIEARASEAIGSEVRIGEVGLVVGIYPGLEIEDLQVTHPLPDRPDRLSASRVELRLAVLPLLARRLHVTRAAIDGVAVRIDPEAFPASEPRERRSTSREPRAAGLSRWSMDVDDLAISDFSFEMKRPEQETTEARVDTLLGRLSWDESIALDFDGHYRNFPISMRVEGASVAQLIQGAQTWPLRIHAKLAGSPIEFEAGLSTVGEGYRIDDMRGHVGRTSLSGWLAIEGFTTKPRAIGRIEIGAIELELPVRESPVESEDTQSEPASRLQSAATVARHWSDESRSESEPEREEEEAGGAVALFMTILRSYESNLELEIESIAGVGPTIESLAIALRVAEGELRFPVAMVADEIPMSGTLHVGSVDGQPSLSFQLAAEHFRVDALAETLLPNLGVSGSFESLRVGLEGRGNSLLGFLRTLRIDLRMANAALTYGADRPVPFGVKRLALTLTEADPITLDVEGSILEEPASLSLTGGNMETFLGVQPWTLSLEAKGAGAMLAISGEAIGYLDELDITGSLSLHGERLSDLEPWLGKLPVPDSDYSIRARIDDTPERSHIILEEARLGKANVVGEFGEHRRAQGSLLWAKLRIARLDLTPYIEAMRSSSRTAKTAPADVASTAIESAEESGIAFDAPILPGGVSIRDADFDIGIDRLVAGRGELEALRFRGAFRDGYLPESEFGFRLGEASFAGAITADLRAPPHRATFEFGTQSVDVGSLLARLGVSDGAHIHAGALHAELHGEGATLAELLQRSDFVARLEDVRWTLRDPNSKADIAIVLDRGELVNPAGDQPIRMRARGSLDGIPVQLAMQTRDLSFFAQPENRVPLDLRLEMAGATLEISSAVLLPIERSALELSFTLSGRNLARASPLFDYELPAIGPYRITSRIRITPDDYRLSSFDLRVGQSRLSGNGRLDMRGKRPRVELALASEGVQLDDFAALFDSAGGRSEATEATTSAPDTAGTVPSNADRFEEIREFWSPEGLLGFDARLGLRVTQVRSGADVLGRGDLSVTLEDGRLALEPLHLELPGGPFELRTEYAYVTRGTGHAVQAHIRARTERFDYGPLARRIDPATDMEGWISLDLDIEGEAPETRALLSHANGRLDFLAVPENVDTDVFDLWAVSLLRFIIPRIDPDAHSILNCVVARFDLRDGILKERALLLDTTRMVVRGDARVDFRKEKFRAVLQPAPKKAQVLSLQTRLEVKGGFDDFQFGVPPEEVARTILRFVTSIVVAPIARIFSAPLPSNGEQTCLAVWQSGKP